MSSGIATGAQPARTTAPGIVLVGVTGASWVLVILQMRGMNMGVATSLGSFWSFVPLWVLMMAAMMLPGAVPAVVAHARTNRRRAASPRFAGSYLLVWSIVGVAAFVLYRPHGTLVAGLVVIGAGIYELTPLKHRFRRRCREVGRTGLGFGLNCLGSSIGLMLVLFAVGVMSVAWMAAVTLLVLAQKLLAPRPAIDVPLALAAVALGVLIIVAPAALPGLIPSM